MKKFIFLVSISILFQSCFSYKTIDYNNIAIDKKQKIVVKGVGGKFIKGQLVSKNDKTMILENKEGQQTISIDEIYDVKVRKFSFLKSAGIIVGGWFTLVIIGIGAIGLVIM
jgi:hypothetical protein|tara:strand:- start:214 stop:549 length:336 start_codon:yes stop_codon:yes gene_type:complete